MKRLVISVSLAGCSCVLLIAGSFWQKKPYTEWSHREINKILGDSPWAAQQAFGESSDFEDVDSRPVDRPLPDSPSEGVPEKPSVPSIVSRQYFIRFQSAAPVRMALARRAVLEERLSQERADELVMTHPAPGYVVAVVQVPPGQDRSELNLVGAKTLKNRVYLRLKESKKRVHLEKYSPPSELGGWEAYLYFPRFEGGRDLFQLEEKEFSFICEFGPRTRLSRRFKLKKMIFRGKLEI